MFAYPKIDLTLEKSPNYHQGWMSKQSNVLKGWNSRYFVLCDGELAWFTEDVSNASYSAKTSTEAERCKHGSLSLEGSRMVKSVPTPPGAYGWFIVTSSGAAVHLRCDSPREREDWVAKISHVPGIEVLNTVPQRKGSLLGRLLRGGHSASGLEGDLSRCSVGDYGDSKNGLASPKEPPHLHSVLTRRGSTEILFASPGADEEICDKFTCPECFQGFADQSLLISHFRSAHGPKVDTLSHGADEENLNAFTCPECYQKCPSQEELLVHFATHGPESNSASQFTPVERSIFNDVAQSIRSENAASSEADPEKNAHASSSNSSYASNPPTSTKAIDSAEEANLTRSNLSVSSNEALYSTYERPSDSPSVSMESSVTATPPPMQLPQDNEGRKEPPRPPLFADQAEALQKAVDAAAHEANAWVDQIVADVNADFTTDPGVDTTSATVKASTTAAQVGAATDETRATAVATTAASGATTAPPPTVPDYSQASARRHAVLLERVGSTALARELSTLSWGGVSWLHSADQRRAELTLEVQCLAPGAVRLAACFKEARSLLAKALAELAANEVAHLRAALEKEVRPQLPIPNLETLADLLADCKSSSLLRLATCARYRDQQAHAARATSSCHVRKSIDMHKHNNDDDGVDGDVLSPTARAHLDMPTRTVAETEKKTASAPSPDEDALLVPVAELFESPANEVLGALWSENDDLLERAGEVQAQCVEAFVTESSAIKEASKVRPMPEAQVRAACEAAAETLEKSVRDGLMRCMRAQINGSDGEAGRSMADSHLSSGRRRYADEQALEARALAKTDPIQVLSEWPAHCAAHLDAAAVMHDDKAASLKQCADALGLEGKVRSVALACRLDGSA